MPKLGTKPEPVRSPEYELTAKLLAEFRQTWIKQQQESGADPMLFSRMSVLALTQLGAIVAVDVGMTQDQFVAIGKANFEQAFKIAPRFAP